MSETDTSIQGRYVRVPNPCTTRPCLPGLAYAVECEGRTDILTIAGRWSPDSRSWLGWTPSLGERIRVLGRIAHHVDIRGEPFWTIEPRSVVPCR